MEKVFFLVLVVSLTAGCAFKYPTLTKYHDMSDQNNADLGDFIGYVNCMNTEVNADSKVSKGSGIINIIVTANQFEYKVLTGTMTSQQVRNEFHSRYLRFVFKYATPDPIAPATAIDAMDSAKSLYESGLPAQQAGSYLSAIG